MSIFSKAPTIDEVMSQNRIDVLTGEQKALQRMLRGYRAAERSIRAKLAKVQALLAAAEGKTEEELSTWLFQNERYTSLLDEIYTEIDKFSKLAETVTGDQQKVNGIRGIADAVKLMKIEVRGSGIRAPSAFLSLNKKAVENMVGVFADGSPLRSLFNTFGKDARNKAHDIMVSGIANGTGPRQIGRELMAEIENLSLERATRIARNESLRVLTTAQKATYDLNSDVIVGSRIVATLDSRTCPMCWARHGTILKPGEPFNRHVTCRCALAPITAFSPDRANGSEEFALIDEAEQLEILGPARFALYQNGQLDLNDLYVETSSKWGPGLKYKKLSQLPTRAPGSVETPVIPEGTSSVIKKRRDRGIIAH